jgi:hypothetical protein
LRWTTACEEEDDDDDESFPLRVAGFDRFSDGRGGIKQVLRANLFGQDYQTTVVGNDYEQKAKKAQAKKEATTNAFQPQQNANPTAQIVNNGVQSSIVGNAANTAFNPMVNPNLPSNSIFDTTRTNPVQALPTDKYTSKPSLVTPLPEIDRLDSYAKTRLTDSLRSLRSKPHVQKEQYAAYLAGFRPLNMSEEIFKQIVDEINATL